MTGLGGFVVAAAIGLLGQSERDDVGPRVERFPPTPEAKRRILEAGLQATDWSIRKASELYPVRLMLSPMSAQRQRRLNALHLDAKIVLRRAAQEQVCRAYDITSRQFLQIMRDDRVKLTEFVPEPVPQMIPEDGVRSVQMTGNVSPGRLTRFNPDEVVLSDKLAKRHGYVNPEERKRRASY